MLDQLNPKDFIITRKRKKYKFAKFHNAENCFEFDEWQHRAVDVIEIGAGTGLFSVELAMRNPDKQFMAVDVKADRLQKGAYAALEQGVKNISFVRARADQVDELVEPHSVGEVWVTFPDPFPKKRSAGRRLTHPTYLAKYASVLRGEGSLLIKHDNMDFFTWSLEQLVSTQWNLTELSFDLHDSSLADEYKVTTTYEQRWLSEGRSSYFVRARVA
jgi:tRNA (guanine-N7-)-methyltransferase